MQYFQVGEEVILQSKDFPHLNGEYVVDGYYETGDRVENPVGYNYVWVGGSTYTLHNSYKNNESLSGDVIKCYIHWEQSALRKKHQGGESFESLMSSIKECTLEAIDG